VLWAIAIVISIPMIWLMGVVENRGNDKIRAIL